MREYDQIAAWYTAARDPEIGAAEVAAFARTLAPGAHILDLGCGDGAPVSQVLAAGGARPVGLDSSREMLARYRARFPEAPTVLARAQDAELDAGTFRGIVAWGVLFHMSAADQEAVIARVGAWLAPGGRFLFTAAAEAGERTGEMDGVAFRYVSLGADGYRRAVERAGMRLDDARHDAWDNYVCVATKPA